MFLSACANVYLKPSPPPTDLSEAEAGLERALHQIASELKNRPNPAFSMVSLGLQTTQVRQEDPVALQNWAVTMRRVLWTAGPPANFLNHEIEAGRSRRFEIRHG
jgi:hypothetical protein